MTGHLVPQVMSCRITWADLRWLRGTALAAARRLEVCEYPPVQTVPPFACSKVLESGLRVATAA